MCNPVYLVSCCHNLIINHIFINTILQRGGNNLLFTKSSEIRKTCSFVVKKQIKLCELFSIAGGIFVFIQVCVLPCGFSSTHSRRLVRLDCQKVEMTHCKSHCIDNNNNDSQ